MGSDRAVYHCEAVLGELGHLLAFPMAKAIHGVVVYHPRGLHVGVHDRGADKRKAALFQVLGQLIGNRAGRRHIVHRFGPILQRFPIHKVPDVVRETTSLFLHLEKRAGILARTKYLETIADNAWIQQ